MCLTPITIKNKRRLNTDYQYEVVPCGKCPKCYERKINAWRFRLEQENKVHVTSQFTTLTYSPEHVPISFNGFMSLRKKDLQDFFKRLRKNTGIRTIKYYAAGEYGPTTMRPHYHAIIFDVTHDDIVKAWSPYGEQIGNVKTGAAASGAAPYTAKYCNKPKKIPMHEQDDREPEFAIMSKGLGKNYSHTTTKETYYIRVWEFRVSKKTGKILYDDWKLKKRQRLIHTPKKQVHEYHRKNLASFVTNPGGEKQGMPRYYKEKIFSESELNILAYEAKAKHAKDFEKYVKQCGGIEEAYRRMHYAKRHQINNFQNQKFKRNETI